MGKPLRVKERKGEGKHPTAAADIFVNSEIQFAEGKHFHSSEECNFRLVHSGMFGPLCVVYYREDVRNFKLVYSNTIRLIGRSKLGKKTRSPKSRNLDGLKPGVQKPRWPEVEVQKSGWPEV